MVLAAAGAAAVVGYTAFGDEAPLGILGANAPLGTVPDVPTGLGSFAFAQEQLGRPGMPVAYSPCEPIRYVVNEAYAPAGGAGLLAEAIGEVSRATGLVFEAAGATDEMPFAATPVLGDHGPVVIAWASPVEVPDLVGDVAGVGGSTAEQTPGALAYYVSGGVALDGPDLTSVLQRPDGPAQVRAIVMHELGHLVGLDHVDDPAELMSATNVGVLTFGPGDREGLAALGSGPCVR
ncbi:zinc metalloprotease [Georgenia ruanii]|uniref:peptidase n=1 Tax=Georgenia ruanii TaxID=348442 RepID=UPI001263F6CC|nr:peptidase [Georgenia ruanii]